MDKKAVQILNRLMNDQKKHSVNAEELAYAQQMGVVVEDQPITLDQALDALERCFEAVSLEDADRRLFIAYPRATWITAIFWRPTCMRAVGFLLTAAGLRRFQRS